MISPVPACLGSSGAQEFATRIFGISWSVTPAVSVYTNSRRCKCTVTENWLHCAWRALRQTTRLISN